MYSTPIYLGSNNYYSIENCFSSFGIPRPFLLVSDLYYILVSFHFEKPSSFYCVKNSPEVHIPKARILLP